MQIQGISQGDIVNVNTVHKTHINGAGLHLPNDEKVVSNFAKLFNSALSEVNDLEVHSTELAERMAVDPESVDIHDVQIAAEQAEMAVLMTKGVVDRVIKAYKEITSLQ